VLETLGRRRITDVTVSELLLLADPNDEGLYLSRFGLMIIEGDQTFATTKRLYWRRSASGMLQIVAEDVG